MTIAGELARFCAEARSRPLPTEVEAHATACLADHLHAALHGARSETGERLRSYLGGPARPRAEELALLLGAASTVHEIDDVHQDTSMHPGSVIVSTALACIAEVPTSGKALLAAVAAGYEVGIRLSIAAGERHYHYFHATATCGTFAAAAVASMLYGLDERQTAHAFGLAATSASGLWEDINGSATGVKHLHSGLAAERGVRAAKLARLGLQSAARSIEGEKGFLVAMARPNAFAPAETTIDSDELRDVLLADLGSRWAILRNIYKRYPFCLACFEPLEGISEIVARTAGKELRSVAIAMYPPAASLVEKSDPRDQLEAKFSAPFAVALVLAGHDPQDARLPVEWLADPAVQCWYPSISVLADTAVPRRHARVTALWSDGSTQTADRPLRSLAEQEVWARFSSACQLYLDADATYAEEMVRRTGSLTDAGPLLAVAKLAAGLPSA